MQRLGIPRPLFSIEDKLARLLKTRYKRLIRDLLADLKAKFAQGGIVTDKAPDDDTLESLLNYFEEMGRELRKEQQEIANRANAQFIANTLEHEWFEEQQAELDRLDEQFTGDVDAIFKREQADYLKRLISDADTKTRNVLVSFTIDKKQFFDANMDAVRKLYLDNSIERIAGEQDLIKRRILKRIVSYAMGDEEVLDLSDLTKTAYEQSDHLARLFARDQMQRFNKACTLATFRSAGVTKVKWCTANDARVRETHKELNGKIFDVDNLPEEVDDYNCRCGLVPVEWAE